MTKCFLQLKAAKARISFDDLNKVANKGTTSARIIFFFARVRVGKSWTAHSHNVHPTYILYVCGQKSQICGPFSTNDQVTEMLARSQA